MRLFLPGGCGVWSRLYSSAKFAEAGMVTSSSSKASSITWCKKTYWAWRTQLSSLTTVNCVYEVYWIRRSGLSCTTSCTVQASVWITVWCCVTVSTLQHAIQHTYCPNHFSRPGRAIGLLCVCLCVWTITSSELNDIWPRYLARWFILTLSRSSLKGQGHRSKFTVTGEMLLKRVSDSFLVEHMDVRIWFWPNLFSIALAAGAIGSMITNEQWQSVI